MINFNLSSGTLITPSKKNGTYFSPKIWDISINKTISNFDPNSFAIFIRHHPMLPQYFEVLTGCGIHGWVLSSNVEEVAS